MTRSAHPAIRVVQVSRADAKDCCNQEPHIGNSDEGRKPGMHADSFGWPFRWPEKMKCAHRHGCRQSNQPRCSINDASLRQHYATEAEHQSVTQQPLIYCFKSQEHWQPAGAKAPDSRDNECVCHECKKPGFKIRG